MIRLLWFKMFKGWRDDEIRDLAESVDHEKFRLDGAVNEFQAEVKLFRAEQASLKQMFDDALDVVGKRRRK